MSWCRLCFAVLSTSFGFLTGCASLDLATDSNALPDAERSIAQKISELTTQRCVKATFRRDTGAQLYGTKKLVGQCVVKRLYSSPNTSWYKAEVLNAGTWDYVYFHRRSGHVVCGEKIWSEWADVRTVSFTEIKPRSEK